MVGRKPLPDSIKIKRGTFRADRAKPASVVAEMAEKPKPRKSLGNVGKAKWEELCGWLSAVNLLDARFLDAMECYCRAWDRWIKYETLVEEEGEFVTVESGYVCAHPAINLAKQARDEIRWYQSEFGFTPSASTKVGGKAPGKKKTGVPSRRRDIGA